MVQSCVLSKGIADTPRICHSIDGLVAIRIFSVENIYYLCSNRPTSAPHITEHVTACAIDTEIGRKKLANCGDSPNSPKFFPLQSFLLYGT